MVNTLELSAPCKTQGIICLNLTAETLAAVGAGGYLFEAIEISGIVPSQLHSALPTVEIVLIDATTGGQETLDVVQKVRSGVCALGAQARILCFSTTHRNPRFVLELEKRGARFVRVSDPAMLLEAIDLLLVEISVLKRNRPCFRISHRFCKWPCAPGEEINGIELLGGHRDRFQLPLDLSGRFVFNYLAESRSLALDSFQIVSGLNGWFYRDHAINCGLKQTTKVRRQTIKVVVQRIRRAMGSGFTSTGLTCDPYDVLRSFPVEGSNRVLYKLHADVVWEHLPG